MDGQIKRGKFLKRAGLVILMGACAMLIASQVGATTLPANESNYKPGYVPLGESPYTIGLPGYIIPANLVASLDVAFVPASPAPDIEGRLLSEVYKNGSGLTFLYRFSTNDLSANGATALVRASIGGVWDGVSISDAGADNSTSSSTAGGGTISWTDGSPIFLGRSPIPGEAPYIQWRAGSDGTILLPGDVSALIWFETDAQFFTVDNVGLIDSGDTSNVAALVPTNVPEPLTMLGMFLGLGGVGAYIRKRRMA